MVPAPIDVAASDLLHRAGFSLGDWQALGPDGSKVWTVTASGPLGEIRAEGSSKAEAWTSALDQVRAMLTGEPNT